MVGYADRELIDALSALRPVGRDTHGIVEAVAGSRHAWLVGQARKLAGWGLDLEAIEDRLRALNDELCMPPLGEREAEFDRMAAWAVKAIQPDRGIAVRRNGRHSVGRHGSRQH